MDIKKLIRKLAEMIFQSNWYPNKKILLESVPDLSCQTYPVFEYMLKQGLNKKYKLIWLVNDKDEFKDINIKNVKFVNFVPKNNFEKIQRFYMLCTCRAMLYSNRYIGKVFDKQFMFYLKHGTCMKSRLKHCRIDENNESDACLSLSSFFTPYDVLELGGITEDKFVITGYPRNDCLFVEQNYVNVIYHDNKYKKTILWMPTFRVADNSNRVDSSFDFPLEIPCLYKEEDCIRLNEVLKSKDMLLVLKPHPAQKLTAISRLNLSNFVILYNEQLKEKNVQLYQFIGSTDALITDYSSIYYDYLLLDKPIGLTVDDFDEYSKTTGFVFDNVFDYIIGEHILNCDDFITFVSNVSNNIDELYEKRIQMKHMFNTHTDNQSTKRVYDYIVNQLESRYKG